MIWLNSWSVSFYKSYGSAINTKDWCLFSFQMRTMPPSCKNAFQATPNGHNAWHWLKVKKVSITCNVVKIAILLFGNRRFHSKVLSGQPRIKPSSSVISKTCRILGNWSKAVRVTKICQLHRKKSFVVKLDAKPEDDASCLWSDYLDRLLHLNSLKYIFELSLHDFMKCL